MSYLEQQNEVDRTPLGAMGYSYGGTQMWNLATDSRVKAVVAYFGIGDNDYYRDKQVWLYNVPYVESPKSPGEELILASIAPEAHVPFITAATLFLNGSNDHHGGHERGLESFKKSPKNVPWSFAIQARGHHDTVKIGHNTKVWAEKHVLGEEVAWPEHPRSEIRLDAEGVPELVITPASPGKVRKVQMFYALKNPCSYARSWRDTPSVRQGQQWIGKLPVLNVDDYVFGYADITYDTTIVRSTDFNAAIPAKLGSVKATDKRPDNLSSGGYSNWSNIVDLEGPEGIKGFPSTNNRRGSGTEQLHDPKMLTGIPCNMKLSQNVPLFWAAVAAHMAALIFACSGPALATGLELTNAPATGGPGKSAAVEIRREAVAKGMRLNDDAQATRISLTLAKMGGATARSYSIRVQKVGRGPTIPRCRSPASSGCWPPAIPRPRHIILNDCEALACLGRYHACKIRGACALALFDANGDQSKHDAALRHHGDALTHWKKYAAIRDTHYVPALYNRVGYVDVTALTDLVAADLDIARNWKPGTLKDDGKRADTEKGFRE